MEVLDGVKPAKQAKVERPHFGKAKLVYIFTTDGGR
jgi:hypothetical protein